MAVNNLKPGFIQIHYTTSLIPHKMTIPVVPLPGWIPGNEPTLETNGVVDKIMSTAINEFIVLIKPFFAATTEFHRAEAWFYPAGVDDPVWVYTHIIGVVGTGAGAFAAASQGVLTFRTGLGGIYKLYMMEITSSIAINSRDAYPFGSALNTNLATYLLGSGGWVFGRDNETLVVPLNYTTKTNDALRKRRLGL